MKIRLKLICLWVLVFINTSIAFGNDQYFFEKISPDAGFAFDAIYSISEDCNGFVWFGCNNGLFYYNTNSIEKVNVMPVVKGISRSIRILDVIHDGNCNLWVCSDAGLFKRTFINNAFDRLLFYSKDSVYSTQKDVEKILQFNEELFLIVIKGKLFYFDKNDNILHHININAKKYHTVSYIGKDRHGDILVGSSYGHIFKAAHPNQAFELFYVHPHRYVNTICDDNNKYYVGYRIDGIEIVNYIGEKILELNQEEESEIRLPDNRIRDIIRTDDGDIWVGTYQGMVVIDNDKNPIITNNMYNGLPHKSIYKLHKGKKGGIWIGTWAGGIAYYSKGISRFNHVVKVPNEKETKSVISSFIEDKDENVWVGSEEAGLSIFNVKEGHFLAETPPSIQKLPTRIKSMTKIDEDMIALGTFSNGIWIYDQKQQTSRNISEDSELENTIISTMAATSNELWIGPRNYHSIYRYDLKTEQFQFFDMKSEKDNRVLWVWKVMFDSSLKLWLCTDEGLFYKYRNEPEFKKYFVNDSVYDLGETPIYTVYEDDNEQIWIGTKGKGLFRIDPVTNKLSEIKLGIYSGGNDVFGIVEDKLGNIWFSTNDGVFEYHKESKNIIRYTTLDGLPGNQFNPNSILKLNNGEVFFGSSNGFSYINPASIKFNESRPQVKLTKLLINNQSFELNENISLNSYNVNEIQNIELSHKDNSLTFRVAANNFIKPYKNRFRYKLDKYDEDWIEIKHNRDITYTKIPPGSYTLEVYGSNNDNIWSEEPLQVDIEIEYPIWQKWYAFVFYLVIVQLIALLLYKETLLRLKLKKEVLTERYKGEAQEQLYAEKMKFFTNVSHEFRTPLTLIISPLENLLRKFKYDDSTFQQLQTIKRNSSRLLRLTNQILDYRLLEVNKLKAKYVKSDIVAICSEVVQCFDLQLKEKQINLIFSSDYKELLIQIDPDMIEKIIYNLLSNAIKFSSDKGQIFITLQSCEGEIDNQADYICVGKTIEGPKVEIKVRDLGRGIKKEILPHIIERFSTTLNTGETGAGIGLHLSQEYAMLHDGNIMFTSTEGQGSTFILNIPVNENAVFNEKSFVKQVSFEENAVIETYNGDNTAVKSKKVVVLLAEDNDELRIYLKNYLQGYYKVVTAKNGEQAYEIAMEVIPDIIITDIMMPITDGIELSQKLKDTPKTRHIPIVILTAHSEVKYQKESLLKGVESYLTKPVEETLLLAHVENILNKRAMIEKHYTDSNETQSQMVRGGGSIIEQAEKIVEQNLQNISFDMKMLIEELNVSRSTFHRKIKNATNLSPSEFIRDIRLKYAIKMTKSGNYNIDEIGSYIGFNSTSYFIRSFKKKYGKTPKEYSKDLNSKE